MKCSIYPRNIGERNSAGPFEPDYRSNNVRIWDSERLTITAPKQLELAGKQCFFFMRYFFFSVRISNSRLGGKSGSLSSPVTPRAGFLCIADSVYCEDGRVRAAIYAPKPEILFNTFFFYKKTFSTS